MTTVVVLILVLGLIGFVTSMFLMFKVLASFSYLLHAQWATSVDAPVKDFVTGGFWSFFRVLGYKGNRHESWILARNFILLLLCFAATMAVMLQFVELNRKHCVFPMSETSRDGAETVICGDAD